MSMMQWHDFVTGGGSEVWVYRRARVRSPPVPVVLSVYQRGSLLDGLVMYLSRDTKGRYLERGLTDRSIGRACRGTGGEANGRSVCPRD